MRAIIDWLQFTFKKINNPIVAIQSYLRMDISSFIPVEKGLYGYRKSYRHSSGILVLYDGTAEMGIHIQMSGQGCRFFEGNINTDWLEFLYSLNMLGVNFTRIDIAVDIQNEFVLFTTDDIINSFKNKEVVTRFRQYNPIRKYDIDNVVLSDTVYIGNRASDMFVRYYDKKLESKSNKIDKWYRWEIVLKNDRANNFIRCYLHEQSLHFLFNKLLNNYIRFVQSDSNDSDRRRWENKDWWDKFIMTSAKLKITNAPKSSDYYDVLKWVVSSVAPSLKTIVACNDGDMTVLDNIVMQAKLSARHERIIENHQLTKK